MIALGPFDLEAPAGKGGMAEVWRAVHRAERVPVAIKVVEVGTARDERYRAALRNEVRAAASLDHGHVVAIFDHGEIPEETAAASGGRLTAASPWLVMEWASGGTLAQERPASWSELRATLLCLLDALAHAHARGVVHRDLKLSNVLRCLPGDRRPGLKLADFGIARPRDAEGSPETGSSGGTVGYMAPEQLLGHWQDQGPWTDLYALGCIAFRLATGALPFPGDSEAQVARAHLLEPVPRLAARIDVPVGFAAWVGWLLGKEPESRPSLAADAALGLVGLGAPSVAAVHRAPVAAPHSDDLETLPWAAWRAAADETPTMTAPPVTAPGPGSAAAAPPPSRRPAPRPVPAVPLGWAPATPARRRPLTLAGTGLGLHGLRTLGLVDRDPERSRLWAALRLVSGERRARAVVLEGATGCGKSRLARWLVERALELGVAHALEARHGPVPGPADGVAPMLARAVRCTGMHGAGAAVQVANVLRALGEKDPQQWAALAALVAPAPTEEPAPAGAPPLVRLGTARERHEVVLRHLVRLGAERPVIVHVDDAQWGPDALSFVAFLLDEQRRAPVPALVVVTVRSEALPGRAVERELLAALAARADVERLPVGPLPRDHWPALVREVLGLDGALASEVEARTAGNPLFAVQLVGDWVARGVLQAGPDGFRLRSGVRAEVPHDLQAVWRQRAADLLAGRADQEACALELAAALGHDVDAAEWTAACERRGLQPAWGVVESMLDLRLARAGERGPRVSWSFVHGMLRESVEQRAAERGRLAAHHRACAEVIEAGAGRDAAERTGRHRLAAGDADAAMAPLLAAAQARGAAGEYRIAEELLDAREGVLAAAGAGDDDPRTCDGAIERARLEVLAGSLDDAERRAEDAERRAREHGWSRLLARALVTRVRASTRRGRAGEARALGEEALALAQRLADRDVEAEALTSLAMALYEHGDLAGAADLQERARALHEALGRTVEATACLYELAVVRRRQGDRRRAAELSRGVLLRATAEGNRVAVANACTSLGQIAREQGDLETAQREYERALGMYLTLGSANAAIARLNLALVLLARDRWAEARGTLLEAKRELERAGWKGLLACAHVLSATCDAGLADWEAWDADLAVAQALLAGWDAKAPDLARAATRAGELADAAGERVRARAAWQIALREWRALGDAAEVARAAAALGRG